MITDKDLRQRLRANLRVHRLAASLSVREASALAQMHVRHWQKIEAGKVNVSLQTLAKLCLVLKITPSDLLGEPPPQAAQAIQ
jgi:DNA-binding Xre family transcriptional regulator